MVHRKEHQDEHHDGGEDEIAEGSLLPQIPTDHASTHESGGDDELSLNANQIGDGSVTNTEFEYLSGVQAPVADKEYVDSAVQNIDWQRSVLSFEQDPPGTPSEGERYIIDEDATGDWAGEDFKIAEWKDSDWVITTPNEGFVCWVEDENKSYLYNDAYPGGEWVAMSSTVNHSALKGLANDDHAQYLLHDGTRNMSGNLHMGNNNITNVGTVDGINISAHDHDGDAPNIPNDGLVNDSVTVTAGTNLSGGGVVALGGTIAINNDIDELDDLSDVSSVSYTDGDVLRANGTGYVTATLGHDDLTNIQTDDHHTRPSAGTGLSESANNFNVNLGNGLEMVGDDIAADMDYIAGEIDIGDISPANATLNMNDNDITNVSDIDIGGELDVTDGTFKMRYVESGAEPNFESGEALMWKDTTNDMLFFSFSDGTNVHHVELTPDS